MKTLSIVLNLMIATVFVVGCASKSATTEEIAAPAPEATVEETANVPAPEVKQNTKKPSKKKKPAKKSRKKTS